MKVWRCRVKQRYKFLVKILIGVICLWAAVVLSIGIRDSLELRNPENNLPEITVYYTTQNKEVEYPRIYTRRESFKWKYLNKVVSSSSEAVLETKIIPKGDVEPQTPMRIEFSYPCKNLLVSRSAVMQTADEVATVDSFTEVSGDIIAPDVPGYYVYKISASWGDNKEIEYFCGVHVVKMESNKFTEP